MLLLGIALACSDTELDAVEALSTEELMDPQACKDCHPRHFEEWSGSMHAYAAEDPVFRAMNARGQRETNGELGDFCVQCHAPIALKLGLTTDGLNLDEVPDYAKGVTCFFCHSVEAIEGDHNAPIRLADDGIMRGGFDNPVPNPAHQSGYSRFLDRRQIESASFCGSCHDIVTPNGFHLEKTFAEWKSSLYSHAVPGEQQTCGDCHMQGRDDVAADADGVVLRQVHNHRMVGVDTALSAFPDMEEQRKQVQRELDKSVFAQFCVQRQLQDDALVTVTVENLAAGHGFPSGATHDRRAWLEVIAYDVKDNIVYQSGVLQEGQALTQLDDPDLWWFGAKGYNDQGELVHMPWEMTALEGEQLIAPTANDPEDPDYVETHQTRVYRLEGVSTPARVTVRLRIRAIGLDLIEDLIKSGDLAPGELPEIPTFDLAFTTAEWRLSGGKKCVP